ncbi:hypothetical protein JKP88DRAFT_224410 [Tribonema minus]|uniref:Uncharacterized protein n=1 Tax=Tribonema minus TaxID=303371 RepID=A0A836CB91_9STRA|nr:hypothetical protein JKP88DRAFT_224410 [Tribonema minus]
MLPSAKQGMTDGGNGSDEGGPTEPPSAAASDDEGSQGDTLNLEQSGGADETQLGAEEPPSAAASDDEGSQGDTLNLEQSGGADETQLGAESSAILEHYKKRRIEIYETFGRDVRRCMEWCKEIEGTLDNVFNKAFHAAQQHIDEAEAELTEELQREEAEAAEVATTKDILQRMMSNLMQATQQINQAGAGGASDHDSGDGS